MLREIAKLLLLLLLLLLLKWYGDLIKVEGFLIKSNGDLAKVDGIRSVDVDLQMSFCH
jgi:hypothetical protein